MTGSGCNEPLSLGRLVDYWFDEIGTDEAEPIEEHVLGCGHCAARLQEIAEMSAGVKDIVASGAVGAIVTSGFVERLKQRGVRVREYRLQLNGSVLCTITPDDDLVVAHLLAPLESDARLDLVIHGFGAPGPLRLEDVPFDEDRGEVVVATESPALRGLGTATVRMQLMAVGESGERVLGDYTFHHAPGRGV